MKKSILLSVVLPIVLLIAGCGKEEKRESFDITGEWRLSAVETKASIGGETVDVYLAFNADKSFMMYQMIGTGRYRKYSGSWALSGNMLTGKYSDGNSWGTTYEVSIDGDALTLTVMNDSGSAVETDTYRRTQIPADVVSGATAYK